jgi:GcrA cell cycle regulator
MMAMNWTEDRVELLKKLWSEGLSASQTAIELGGGISRNAVIGKVHRLGLSARAKSQSSSVPLQRKPRAQGHAIRIGRGGGGGVHGNTALAPLQAYEAQAYATQAYATQAYATQAYANDVEPEPQLIENVIPIGQRCSILDLNNHKCRWPIGDPSLPDFFFCGGKSVGGMPYCAYHSRMAYQPAADRRRDRRISQG